MLDKNYDAQAVEPRIRDAWERADAFRAGAGAAPGATPFSIVIPPPNVTGSLHMGHALNNTLQDVLARFERMRGRDVLWQPGMDHAGIATQMVVERQMAERQEPDRRTIGRDAFLEKVWAWKAESGGAIVNQLKRLGASCDWSRERFTMDEGLSRAVRKVFVQLFKEGLIYRDKRLVNWDPKLLTAISDLEVQQVEVKGHLWHFRYPIEGMPGRFITVATTRPETMLGDTGVAVHPDDERYRDLVRRTAVLPLVGRRIPIVADEYADPEAGTGAVKITPAHDFNDFEVGRRHGLRMISIFTPEADIKAAVIDDIVGPPGGDAAPVRGVEVIPEQLRGLDRFTARARVVAMMEELGLLETVEDHVHVVPHGDRSGVPIEPLLTDQWYVDAKTLAAPAIEAVRAGRTAFVPQNWEKTYFDWMENIQPWCISRQLWWGHRIPAWYGPNFINDPSDLFVEESEEAAYEAARQKYVGSGAMTEDAWADLQATADATFLRQDEDVLDTWFSSALWPFSTMGWPDETRELQRYYPTSVLVTGFDIIFFWVARMMMMGIHFMGPEPFATVYIHALVRDEHGAKMSKSKGNVIDPLELIDEYGADALRFTLAAMAAQGRDIKLSTARVAGYRNFATKLWNAARFCEMNGCRIDPAFRPEATRDAVNRWILTEADRTTARVTSALEGYRFNEAADGVYHFVWNSFCDWYVELAKPVLLGEDAAAKAEVQATAAHVLEIILRLLHPFMPYITEALRAEIGRAEDGLVALSHWPAAQFEDVRAAAEINWLIEVVTAIRSVRSEMNVPPAAKTPLVMIGGDADLPCRLQRHEAAISRMARVEGVSVADRAPEGSAQIVLGDTTVALPLAGVVDFAAERTRLEKEAVRIDGEIGRLDKKLGNASFIERAPPEVVETERQKLAEYRERAAKLAQALEQLPPA